MEQKNHFRPALSLRSFLIAYPHLINVSDKALSNVAKRFSITLEVMKARIAALEHDDMKYL